MAKQDDIIYSNIKTFLCSFSLFKMEKIKWLYKGTMNAAPASKNISTFAANILESVPIATPKPKDHIPQQMLISKKSLFAKRLGFLKNTNAPQRNADIDPKNKLIL